MFSLCDSRVIQGDAEEVLRLLPDQKFRCCVTSPPYWGLRDYGQEGQIGLEPEPEQYIQRLVQVFGQVSRILKDDGTLWINIGDCYTSGNRSYRASDKKNPTRAMSYRAKTPHGLKPKDLIGIPWRLAFALQRAGWFLRSDIIWEKPNAMPESVQDRPTRSHEYLFLFSKCLRYYYDAPSVRVNNRNRRTVWSIPISHPPRNHLATFPPKLVEPCILAGTESGDWALDPFSGSGTVGVVCKQLQRNYVGIELNPESVEISIDRIGISDRVDKLSGL